jgi:hypothetical protein
VQHIIKGTIQEILITIYPFKSFYYKWEDMKKEYEGHKRCLARIRSNTEG